jgi:hypothetical protein
MITALLQVEELLKVQSTQFSPCSAIGRCKVFRKEQKLLLYKKISAVEYRCQPSNREQRNSIRGAFMISYGSTI